MKKFFLLLCCIFSITTITFAGNLLANGNMESQGGWQVNYLNSVAGQNPTATWGYTADKPAAGVGGALYVKAATTVSGSSQYCIYQAITLSADSVYSFDAAFKNINLQNAWCEAYLGSIPVTGQDYAAPLGTKIASYDIWSPSTTANGTFKLNASTYNQFTPATTGVYYFVLKIGCGMWDSTVPACEVIVDELSLTATRTKPEVGFLGTNIVGFPTLTTTFTNTSKFATSYEWNFGDGSATSFLVNPQHEYTKEGSYTVTLKASNEVGDSTLVKTNFVIVNTKPALPAGEKLYGGNMENPNFWIVDFLNSPANLHPVASWNNTTNVPTAGAGGCLYINGPAGSGANVQYAIYQKVNLSSDSVYNFDGAFRDFTTGLKNFWTEIYIGGKPAGDGSDYGPRQTMIAKFDGWNAGSAVSGLDGTFQLNAINLKPYIPTVTGDYYLVVKTGVWDGIGFKIAMDELKLTGTPKTFAGINNFHSDRYKITTRNHIVQMDAVSGNIELFDISGRCIQTENTTGKFASKALNPGMYIVRVDGFTIKVAVQ
ncbi:MAG: PKD domain-containing protein [Bacteroidota bacterium]|nr:PKD domain-containing protein [Bacteroidota bacterium]